MDPTPCGVLRVFKLETFKALSRKLEIKPLLRLCSQLASSRKSCGEASVTCVLLYTPGLGSGPP